MHPEISLLVFMYCFFLFGRVHGVHNVMSRILVRFDVLTFPPTCKHCETKKMNQSDVGT